jgi:hypothetical protein
MIVGAHWLLYSQDPETDRAFLRDVLDLRAVDAGGGWLIFALPPSELAVHPGSGEFVQRHAEHSMIGSVLYLMCNDLRETMDGLRRKGVTLATVTEAPWGSATSIRLPSGGEIGLYEPSHPTAI